jgi:hypothetical protein
MLFEPPVLSSGFSFNDSNYDYNYTNTNVGSHLCRFRSINRGNKPKNKFFKKSAGSLGEGDLLKAKEEVRIPCKISNWGCVYHACMSDDCQKRFMPGMVDEYGEGECNEKDQ